MIRKQIVRSLAVLPLGPARFALAADFGEEAIVDGAIPRGGSKPAPAFLRYASPP
jgi:hypothetical protein